MKLNLALALLAVVSALAQSSRKPTPGPRAPSPATRWGQITGQLSNQTDLQNALDAKQPALPKGYASDYIRGDHTIAVFPPTNGVWGSISGDIGIQSDLQSELGKRVPLYTKLNAQSGTGYSINQSDAGALIVLNNAGVTTVSVPANLPLGFSCAVLQLGGEITFVGNGAALRQRNNYTKSAGPYAVVTIMGFAPNTFVLAGDMR